MNILIAEVKVQTESRAAIYGFIAWLFLNPPDADFITHLLANDMQGSLADLPPGSASSKMLEGLQTMRSYLLENSPRPLGDKCLALAVEHTRYLRGAGRTDGPPPPYESLYRTSGAGEDNAVLLQLVEFYKQAQAAICSVNAERVDYLGIELDLMRLLCEEESRAINLNDAAQTAYFSLLQQCLLREHLLVWAPRFCETFLTQTSAGFYHGVAQLLLGFLELEASLIREGQGQYQALNGGNNMVREA